MSEPLMTGTHRDAMDPIGVAALGAEQHRDRRRPLEGEHATARPQTELPGITLELFHRQRRLDAVRAAAGVVGVDQEGDVVGAAETVARHEDGSTRSRESDSSCASLARVSEPPRLHHRHDADFVERQLARRAARRAAPASPLPAPAPDFADSPGSSLPSACARARCLPRRARGRSRPTALARELFDPLLGAVAHEARRHAEDARRPHPRSSRARRRADCASRRARSASCRSRASTGAASEPSAGSTSGVPVSSSIIARANSRLTVSTCAAAPTSRRAPSCAGACRRPASSRAPAWRRASR